MAADKSLLPIKRFFNLLKVEKQEIFSIYLYAIFSGIVSLSLPLGIQAIISFMNGGLVSSSWIILVILVIAGVALTGLMQIMQLAISENLQQKIFTRSAFEFAFRIPKMKLEALHKTHIPELINRFFDTITVQKGLSKILIDFSSALLQVVFGLILLSFYHPFFILFSILLLVLLYIVFKVIAPKGFRTSLSESKSKYEVVHWLEEVGRTIETFKLHDNRDLPLEKTDKLVGEYLTARKTHFKTLLFQYFNLVGFKVLIAAALLIIGGLLVINQQMNIGQFVASEIIIILILSSAEKLIFSVETIYDVLTAVEKISNVTDIPLEEDDAVETTVHIDEGPAAIKINNLNYTFPGETKPILQGINLDINGGEKICISGYSNAGKTVLLKTVAGLYLDYGGTITVNKLTNKHRKIREELIKYHFNTNEIFQGTILENIGLSTSNANYQELENLSKNLGLSNFIEELPNGYQTILQPEGKNISRTNKVKILLLRCLINKPKLLILGNDLAYLNLVEQHKLLNYLLGLDLTLLVISNQKEVFKKFSRGIILKEGKIALDGSYYELENSKEFNELFNITGLC